MISKPVRSSKKKNLSRQPKRKSDPSTHPVPGKVDQNHQVKPLTMIWKEPPPFTENKQIEGQVRKMIYGTEESPLQA